MWMDNAMLVGVSSTLLSCWKTWGYDDNGKNMALLGISLFVLHFSLCAGEPDLLQQPFTDDFPRADIHELIAPDILHQLIKGAFKDHIVTWVQTYITSTNVEKDANRILDDIDRRYVVLQFYPREFHDFGSRIAIVAPFSELRRFPQGRNFKQWTGDDSKALMKVINDSLLLTQSHVIHVFIYRFTFQLSRATYQLKWCAPFVPFSNSYICRGEISMIWQVWNR
jgi:Plavaka transposase